MSGGNERRLGLGGTQLMAERPLGTPEPAPPRAPGTQLIAQTPQQHALPPEAFPPQVPPNPEFHAPPVPAYGIPPDAFPMPQAPLPQSPPAFDYGNAQPLYGAPPPAPQITPLASDYANALPLYGGPPAQYVQQNHGTFAPKTDHLGPRLKGGAVLLFGLALLGFNAFLIFTQDSFYPKTLILAFPLSWVGVFMVLAGKPVNPSSQHPPAWWMVLCYGGAFFAFVVGIIAAIMITD
jgi:hypothetical protein